MSREIQSSSFTLLLRDCVYLEEIAMHFVFVLIIFTYIYNEFLARYVLLSLPNI